ncbi:MAG TPA: hypothetical protein DDY68_02580 [Porphyromonadaceae bacterium]|nr:hypothetical protein [Porphyromonadaceae bacterium]
MKRVAKCSLFIVPVFCLLSLCFGGSSAYANEKTRAIVVEEHDDDYCIVQVDSDYYIVRENWGDLDEGDVLVGNIKGTGNKELYNESRDEKVRVYVQGRYDSKRECIRWLKKYDHYDD